MDDQLNNRQREILQRLLADPADTGAAYLSNLQDLVKNYPQSGLFRALYGRALNESSPQIAGAYFDSRALHKLLFHADNISTIARERVIFQNGGQTSGTPAAGKPEPAAPVPAPSTPQESNNGNATAYPPQDLPDALSTPKTPEQVIEVSPVMAEAPPAILSAPEPAIVETPAAHVDDEPLGRAPWELDDDYEDQQQPVAEERAPAEIIEEEVYEEPVSEATVITAPWETAPDTSLAEEEEPLVSAGWELPVEQPYTENTWAGDETAGTGEDANDRLAYWHTVEDEYDAPAASAPDHQAPFYTHETNDINDEVYDEISGIDDIAFTHNPTEYYEAPTEPETAEQSDADRLIMGNIASADYFTFDKAFGNSGTNTETSETAEPAQQPAAKSAAQSKARFTLSQENTTHHDVSKYHDDKMPYSFMWWLDKTRKEHGSLYQPYAYAPVNNPTPPPAKRPVADELQQQYYENIFHFSSVDELGAETPPTVEFDMQSKEDRIIQRFIAEDPHIHPPVGEKLDTENKAKKSSEDSDIMVTETLARIYADQMLFPKAIATYKKLMLKFPEKSRYFASRIENLEKKNN